MSVLQTIPDIAKTAGVSREQVRTALKHAGVEPAHTVKTGSRTMTLYDSAAGAKAVDSYLADLAHAESERRIAEVTELPSLTAIAMTIDGLVREAIESDAGLTTIAMDVRSIDERIESLSTMVTRLADQNVLLFRALSAMETDHTGRLARLQNSLVDMQRGDAPASAAPAAIGVKITPLPPLPPAPPAPTPSTAPTASAMSQALSSAVRTAAAAKPARKLARVLLVGARGADRAAIEREFKDCFDLRCVEDNNLGSEALKTQLRTADRVVLAFGSSSVTAVKNALKGSGVNVVHVNGGMSRLRDALTTLYVELGEAVPA